MTKTDNKLDNVIFIGQKPIMLYVFATHLQASKNDTVKVRARGMTISRAVDVIEITLDKERDFLPEWKVEKIEIGSDLKPASENNKEGRVSFIEITIVKK